MQQWLISLRLVRLRCCHIASLQPFSLNGIEHELRLVRAH